MTDRTPAFSVTLDDCEVQTFRAGGKGGQAQNKRDTGVRIRHPESGAVGEARDSRSQLENKKTAFRRMTETAEFRAWTRKLAAGDELLKVEVDRELWPDRTLVEVKDEEGRWKPL